MSSVRPFTWDYTGRPHHKILAISTVSKSVRPPRTGKSAVLVFLGIFVSRISGLIRQTFIAHYFGLSDVADTLLTAFRIPNVLQNLLGEEHSECGMPSARHRRRQ